MNELKYCKFCDKEKPIKDFAKSGFAIKNICRECQNKKNNQIYKNSKKVEKLEQENKQLKDNWNKLKEWVKMEHREDAIVINLTWKHATGKFLDKMQEIEQGSDSNDSN